MEDYNMAYKFQLGAAVLSGSINVAAGAISGSAVSDTLAASIVSEIDNGEIPIAKLAAKTISGKDLGENLDSLAVDDSTIEYSAGSAFNGSAASTIRVKDLGITNDKLAGSIADSKLLQISTANKVSLAALDIDGGTPLGGATLDQADLFIFDDGAGGTNKKITFSNLEDSIFGNVSGDATIAAGGALTIANDAVEQAMIADDAVGADQLASNAVVDASVASDAAISLAKINTNVDLGGNITFGNQSDDTVTFSGGLVVAGNLTVQGASVEVQQGFVVTSSVHFEGSTPDANEVILTAADAQGSDKTITLPDVSGHVPLLAGAISTANVTAAEFGLLDGGSSVGSTGLLDSDGFLHNDGGVMKQTEVVKIAELAFGKVNGDVTIAANGDAVIQANAVEGSMLNNNVISGLTDIGADIVGTDELLISDNGTIRRTDMSRLKTYVGTGIAAVNAIGDANATLAVGLNVTSEDASASRTWTLPASAGLTAGESVIIKAYANAGTYPITIAGAGSQDLDTPGTDQILLESDNAAVTLYYVGDDFWIIT
tara:strand:- start:1557 stop:3188 length:1632 start_codon:yes stop_codon:yes gene_type:complete